ncbi:O-antigen ligase family protein [Anaerospora sp.]|uniref:O-antigen ligase family protein n=1 Tax=Anaerospora sp. TaxID=1960278 RepID=UPI0028966C1B|nr:O-antigen ligase family protein [Anaerospora sp.]
MNYLLNENSKSVWSKFLYIVIMTAVLFAGICLYSLENEKWYIGIILLVSLYTFYYCIANVKRLINALSLGYTWWIILMFSYYTFYGTVLPVYGEYNAAYVLFIAVVIINIIILFSSSHHDATSIFISSATIASVFACMFIISYEFSLILDGGTRIGESASGNVNTVGMYLGTFSILSIYKVIYEKKNIYFVIYVLQILFMLLTGSKKALMFIFIGLMLLFMLKNKLKLQKYFFPLIVCISSFTVLLTNDFFYNIIGQRTIDFLAACGFQIESASESNSTSLRLLMYQVGLQAFQESPIIGNGWFYFSVHSGLGMYSHNNYIELLVNYGVLGFIAYYSMFAYVLYKISKNVFNNDYAKLYFTLIITELVNDTAAITFCESPRGYLVLLFAYLFVKKIDFTKRRGLLKS